MRELSLPIQRIAIQKFVPTPLRQNQYDKLGGLARCIRFYPDRTVVANEVGQGAVKLTRNASAVSDAPRKTHATCTLGVGAHSIQPFEGSRPWGGRLCIFNVVGFRGEGSGIDTVVDKNESGKGSVVVCLW